MKQDFLTFVIISQDYYCDDVYKMSLMSFKWIQPAHICKLIANPEELLILFFSFYQPQLVFEYNTWILDFFKKKKKRKRCLPPPTIVTILRFQLCLHSPDPWPTGPLKMKKVQGDGMFNAWSHLPPLRPPLLSQDAACTNTLSVTGWQSPGVNDDTHWGLWAWIVESQRRSSEWI